MWMTLDFLGAQCHHKALIIGRQEGQVREMEELVLLAVKSGRGHESGMQCH